jgi:hypothetical protein
MDNWNSLGDVRELERKANKILHLRDMEDWGRLTLRLIDNIKYLNGCVKRGRGSDIDEQYPIRNIFEYIKELEGRVATHAPRLQKASEEVRDPELRTQCKQLVLAAYKKWKNYRKGVSK